MALKSIRNIKNKITNMAEGENLGDAKANPDDYQEGILGYEFDYQPKNNTKIKRPKSISEEDYEEEEDYVTPKKAKKEKVVKEIQSTRPNKMSSKVDKINKNKSDKAISEQMTTEGLIEGYKDILSMLGIKELLDLNTDFTSEDLDYVEFTQTQPLGFDFDEVTDFISRIKYNLYKYEAALRQRNLEIKKLASEVKRVEEKMIAQNQAKELERMIGGMTEEERLIEENMDLKVQINEVKRTLRNLEINSGSNKELMKRIEALEIENDILKQANNNQTKPVITKHTTPKLPSVSLDDDDINDVDLFTDMLDDIGGLYDE